MVKCNVLMFAAGLGTRLRPYTLQHPKPALPLFQIPLGYYLLPYINKLNVQNFVVNTFHLPDLIRDVYSKLNLKIKFSNEKDYIRGSAGGIKYAEQLLDKSTTLVCNSDEVLFAEDRSFLLKALELHENNNNLATLIVMEHPEAGKKFGGIWTEKNSTKVVHIGKECPVEGAQAWHFVGLQFLSGKVLDLIPTKEEQNIFYDILIKYLKSESIEIYSIKTDWYETGNLEDYSHAKQEINKQVANQNKNYLQHFEDLKKLPLSSMSDLS